GSCKGPNDDIYCTNIRRTLGFEGYLCECLAEYSGTFCHDHIPCEGNQCQTAKPDGTITLERYTRILVIVAVVGILLLLLVQL
uniref:hypothetical protein n=1 Tax=Salmonella sp. s51228 TaxID=3159652 RepID=UPI00397F0170